MGRYLTPGRICLLTLIEIYLSHKTSTQSGLPILNLIAQQIITPSQHDHSEASGQSVRLTSDLSSWSSALRQWPSDIPGRNTYDVLLQRIWSLDGLDSLHQLFNEFNDIVDQHTGETSIHVKRISRTSPLSQFIRRCCVDFTRLQFNDSLELWHSFVVYRQSSHDEWSVRYPEQSLRYGHSLIGKTPHGKTVETSDMSSASCSRLCVADVNDLMTHVVQNLQRFGTRVPEDIRTRLDNWISTQWETGTQSLRFFMSFFENWRAGQYLMALESLHQYFDYSLAARRASDNMRAHYQYALLHLSVLHADFDCWDESIDAMNECIATARENQDIACLNFALSWLLYLRHANPRRLYTPGAVLTGTTEYDDHDEIAFLKTKAKESKQWLLLSSTLLEQAKTEIYANGNTARAQECILQSMYLNSQHDLRTFMPAVSMLYGASLERLGQTHIASRTYEAIAAVHATLCPMPDMVNALCRLAYLTALEGRFGQAISRLESLMQQVHHIPKHKNRIIAYMYLIKFRQNILRGTTDVCIDLLPRLKATLHLNDPELVSEVHSLETELLIQLRRFGDAFDWVNALILQREDLEFDLAQRIATLRQRSQVLAISTKAGKVLTTAVRITSVAERLLLPNLLSMATNLLTCILAEHAEFSAAYEILQSIMPVAMEIQDQQLISQLLLTLSDICVGMAGQVECTLPLKSRGLLRLALHAIEKVDKVSMTLDSTQTKLQCQSRRSLLKHWHV